MEAVSYTHLRDYSYSLNKKVKRLAFKSALSSKVQDDEMIVVDSIKLDEIKTKTVVAMLDALKAQGKVLIVMPEVDKTLIKSAGNIPGVKTTLVNTLNVYDVLNCDKIVVVKDAVTKIEEVYALSLIHISALLSAWRTVMTLLSTLPPTPCQRGRSSC